MIPRRRNRGFERAGSFEPEELGLPDRRNRELRLALAWAAVAGEEISRCAPAVRIRRGVLEVEAEDSRWAEIMWQTMPRLAGRLAKSHPELGVRKWRLLHDGAAKAATPVVQKE